ncbi:Esterase-like protein [Ceratocystis lukuohia]|uniref:Esterase-like protein n=1 Tax=Ceratocystis lukuohia TaxID=2019550 RepID=A0ABR4MQL7_9PEZI
MTRAHRAIGLSRQFSHLTTHAAKAPDASSTSSTSTLPPTSVSGTPLTGPTHHEAYIPSTFETLPNFDATSKTISTSAGALPASPIMDPEWRMTQGFFRASKPRRRPPVGRFRKLFSRSPYARMLASPLRVDPLTDAFLPREFLASFEVVRHPETSSPWWAPLIEDVPPLVKADVGEKEKIEGEGEREDGMEMGTEEDIHEEAEAMATVAAEPTAQSFSLDAPLPDSVEASSSNPAYIATPRLARASQQPSPDTSTNATAPQIKTPSNLRAYTILSSRILSTLDTRLGGSPKGFPFLAARRSNHMAWIQRSPPVWHHDMAGVMLAMLRARALDDFALLADPASLGKKYPKTAAAATQTDAGSFAEKAGPTSPLLCAAYGTEWLSPLVRVASWAELLTAVPDKTLRGAVLWLPASADAVVPADVAPDGRTYAFAGVQYNAHVPIHNLTRLLGEEGVLKVRGMFPEMRDAELVLLVRPASIHLRTRLWQLEGYLSETGPTAKERLAE